MAIDVKDIQEIFEETKNAWDEEYREGAEDLKFQHGGSQWDAHDRAAREAMNRPCLEVNLLPQFERQVINDFRMSTPTIAVSPVGDGADVETAKIIKGLVRNIEYTSSAMEAYVTALESAVKGKIGFFRIDHDFERVTGFEQQIFIRKVVNPYSCWIDPSSIESDGCDAMFGFSLDQISEKEFERKYSDAKKQSFDGSKDSYLTGKKHPLMIAEFFKIKEEEKKAALMEDGSIVEYAEGMDGVRSVRSLVKKTVGRYKVSGADILEETIFPGVYVPLIPVYGEESWIEGKRKLKSLVHDMKDPQKMHNYWASLKTQSLMMQPIAPVMAAVGQTEEWKDDWDNPGQATVLRYKTTDVFGNQIPPPQRLSPPTTPTGLIEAQMSSAENMKQTVGMYNESLGQRSNAVSGIAINNRKVEGEVATLHFADNCNRSIAHGGRVILSMIPEIYDTKRAIRIMGEEDVSSEVGINGHFVEGQKQAFSLTAGQYDLRVSSGTSYTTKRQEAQVFLQELIRAVPEMASVSSDILVSNMDFKGSEALAERLKKMVPPNLLSDKEKQEAQSDPEKEQMAQVIQQSQQLVEQAAQKIAQLEEALKNKDQVEQAKIQIDVAKLELEKEKIANDRMKIEVEAHKADVESNLKAAEIHLQATMPEKHLTAPSSGETGDSNGEDEMGMGIAELEALLNAKKQQAEQKAMQEQEQATMEQQHQQMMMQQQADEMARQQAEKQAEVERQMALTQAIVSAVNNLTAAVTAPKQVIRGDDGRVMGVQ
jgi:hypothetical protein